MKPTTDLSRVLHYGILLVFVIGLILWFSRPLPGSLPPARSLAENKLDTERQTLLLRVDSLATLLNTLQRSGVFAWADEGNKLQIDNQGDIKQFEQLFLMGYALPDFTKLQHNPIKAAANGQGFSLPVTEQKGVRLVRLPAHMVQSMQLYEHNQ
ncbi:hypothetical protein [Spirosoma fluviale]|uniref:Uncharacterized protein n=1 Tax=Spirosoma fluviale TaxID=1597977 RepID=A0A286GLR1_9BACT|nr:hypothetical protein [Spirosoma fluviale]SOD96432.1 hypothetical protein SAMN06269250_5306 [Spirosoma fluviale]